MASKSKKQVGSIGESLAMLKYFFVDRYPRRAAVVIILLLFSGLAEGMGVAMLLPLLGLAVAPAEVPQDGQRGVIVDAIEWVGLQPDLETMLALLVAFLIAKAVMMLISARAVASAAAVIAADLRFDLIESLMKARWGYFVSRPVGRYANAVGAETLRAGGIFSAATNMFANLIRAGVYAGLAVAVAWELTVLAVLVGGLSMALLWRFVTIVRQTGAQQTDLFNSMTARLTDGLVSLKPLKAMARENHLLPLLRKETAGLQRAQTRQAFSVAALKHVQEPLFAVILAVGLFVALSTGKWPFETLMFMVLIFHRTLSGIGAVQFDYQKVAAAVSPFSSLRHLIEETGTAREDTRGGTQHLPATAVAFRDVRFGFGDHVVLGGVSLEIPCGGWVAVTGPSGAGKTTIADIVCGLFRPESGEVYLDGVPLGDVDTGWWRRQIGYVPQEMVLFHDTIRANVALGAPEIPDTEVERALREAGVWDVIAALPEGLDTVVGERGARLSGGQRQRIAIARALVHRPMLLILDEATTALDPETEKAICRTLADLREQVTVLAISHQAALVDAADIVYRLEAGQVSVVRDSRNRLAEPAQ